MQPTAVPPADRVECLGHSAGGQPKRITSNWGSKECWVENDWGLGKADRLLDHVSAPSEKRGVI